MLRAIRAFFSWKTVRDTGLWLYQVNTTTGLRRVVPYLSRTGYQPVDARWLKTGEWGPGNAPPRAGIFSRKS